MSGQSGDRDERVLHLGSLSSDVPQQKQLLFWYLIFCMFVMVSVSTPPNTNRTHTWWPRGGVS